MMDVLLQDAHLDVRSSKALSNAADVLEYWNLIRIVLGTLQQYYSKRWDKAFSKMSLT